MVCSVIKHSSRPIINARGFLQLWQNLDWMTSYSFKNFKIPTLKMCIRTMTIFLFLFISATKLTLLESRTACFERNLIFVKMFEVWSQCLNNNWRDYVSLVPRVFSFSNMAAAGGKTLAHSRVTWLSGSHKQPIPYEPSKSHHLCFEDVNQSEPMYEMHRSAIVLGCCVPGSSHLSPPYWKTRRSRGPGWGYVGPGVCASWWKTTRHRRKKCTDKYFELVF